MIDLHYWTTPNGYKIVIFLEEAGLPYRIIPVNISTGDQFKPEFLAISLNNRIPAIVDHKPKDGGKPVSIFESGAILLYLAEKTGKFLQNGFRHRCEVMQWLFWQMGGLGPMAGQNHHFSQYAPEKLPYAIERYVKETNRLYGGSRIAPSSPVTTPLPTWRHIRGSCRMNGKARSSRIFRTSSAGSIRSPQGPPPNAPMSWRRRSTFSRP